MDLIVVRGKSVKNTKAYVLLPPECKAAMEVLLKCRDSSCAPLSNKFIFARQCADTPISGITTMKALVQECSNLEKPDRITSTKLRKYIATVSQVIYFFSADSIYDCLTTFLVQYGSIVVSIATYMYTISACSDPLLQRNC